MPTFRDFLTGRSAVTIADADELYVRDDDTDSSKKIAWSAVKTALGLIYAPISSPTFTGNVVVPTADADTEALNRITADGRYVAKVGQVAWINDFTAVIGSPTASTVFRRVVWLLNGTTNTALGFETVIPTAWATFHADMVWLNADVGSGDVVVRLDYTSDGDGDTISANPTSRTPVTATALAQNVVEVTRLATGVTATPGEVMSFNLVRIPGDPGDTLANDIGVRGILLTAAT